MFCHIKFERCVKMKNFEEFKTRFEAGEFDEQFKSISSPEDVVELAKSLGYDISLEEITSVELDEDKLEMVAGGKNNTKHETIFQTNVIGNDNIYLDV